MQFETAIMQTYKEIKEGRFKYYESGEGEVLILLHGLFGALSNFHEVIDYFSDKVKVCIPVLPLYDLSAEDTKLPGMVSYVSDFIEHKGNSSIYGSKDATREAFKLGLIENGDVWMKMIESRNQTSHTYNEVVAKEMVSDIQQSYFEQFLLLEKRLMVLLEKEK